MRSVLLQIGRSALLNLAEALERGKLAVPFEVLGIGRYVPSNLAADVTAALRDMAALEMSPLSVAHTLRLLGEARQEAQALSDRVDLVWTGPEALSSTGRDTAVVVQELFASAKRSVLVSSFAVDEHEKSNALFKPLAERMDEVAELQVRMFLNVPREYGSDTADSVILRQFAESFRERVWPGVRRPEVFYDPRSLAPGAGPRACLHAKCVVVDDKRLLITSANFTEAAHRRNIEAGVVLRDSTAAKQMRFQFEALVTNGSLVRLPGIV